ncbi:7795_t:CDS:2, partial [Cetraspora pellucida]
AAALVPRKRKFAHEFTKTYRKKMDKKYTKKVKDKKYTKQDPLKDHTNQEPEENTNKQTPSSSAQNVANANWSDEVEIKFSKKVYIPQEVQDVNSVASSENSTDDQSNKAHNPSGENDRKNNLSDDYTSGDDISIDKLPLKQQINNETTQNEKTKNNLVRKETEAQAVKPVEQVLDPKPNVNNSDLTTLRESAVKMLSNLRQSSQQILTYVTDKEVISDLNDGFTE